MNGGWFWWCRQSDPSSGSKKFKTLWHYQFNYFTKKKKPVPQNMLFSGLGREMAAQCQPERR